MVDVSWSFEHFWERGEVDRICGKKKKEMAVETTESVRAIGYLSSSRERTGTCGACFSFELVCGAWVGWKRQRPGERARNSRGKIKE